MMKRIWRENNMKKERVTIRISSQTKEKLEKVATANKTNVSKIVGNYISKGLNQNNYENASNLSIAFVELYQLANQLDGDMQKSFVNLIGDIQKCLI